MFESFPFAESVVPSATYPYHQQRLEPPSVGNAAFTEGKMQIPRDFGLRMPVESAQEVSSQLLPFTLQDQSVEEAREAELSITRNNLGPKDSL